MVRPGKEPMAPCAAADDAEQHEARDSTADSRRLNGVSRQQHPDAAAQRLAASQAAAERRSANAMA